MENGKSVYRLQNWGIWLMFFLGIGLAFLPGFVGKTMAADKVFSADKGEKTVDLNAYPKPYQERYQVFSRKCSKCHTLARPINTNFGPSQWKKYVKRMLRKPDSSLSREDIKNIWEFLVFDTSERKKDFWKKLPPEEIKMAETSFSEVLKVK